LPYSLNSKFEFKLIKKFYRYDDLKCFYYYNIFNEDLNFIGKENFFIFLNNYYNKAFPIFIFDYFNYVTSLVNSFDSIFKLNTKFISDKLLPYGDKIVRVKARDHIKSFLYGFKFHFVGRFTRKQQSASM